VISIIKKIKNKKGVGVWTFLRRKIKLHLHLIMEKPPE
jgi:hypothetical protein